MSLILAFCYLSYAFVSLPFINRFSELAGHGPVDLIRNVLPRFVLNVIPFIFLFFLLKFNKKVGSRLKIAIWSISFPLITVLAAYIYVWPLALDGMPIIPYVNAANNVLVIIVASVAAPPIIDLLILVGAYFLFFISPLLYVCYLNGDPGILFSTFNDSLFFVAVAFILGVYYHSIHLAVEKTSSSHLNRRVVENLQSGEKIPREIERGFVLSFDIRGFTQLLKSIQGFNDRELLTHPVIEFYSSFRATVSRISDKYGCVLHKTTGDGAIGLWGILDHVPNLALTGESEESALFKLNVNFFDNSVSFFQELVEEVKALSKKYKMDVTLGAGLCYGKVVVEEYGEKSRELDIIGVPIIESVRSEAHSKFLIHQKGKAHYLVVSSECSEFVKDSVHSFRSMVAVESSAVRDFPERKRIFYQIH